MPASSSWMQQPKFLQYPKFKDTPDMQGIKSILGLDYPTLSPFEMDL